MEGKTTEEQREEKERMRKKIIAMVVFMLLVKALVSRRDGVSSLLFVLGAYIGFALVLTERYLDKIMERLIPAGSSEGKKRTDTKEQLEPLFFSGPVTVAYCVFALIFLITNRSAFANGMVIGYGARILFEVLMRWNHYASLRATFFKQLPRMRDSEIRYAIAGYMAFYIVLVVIA